MKIFKTSIITIFALLVFVLLPESASAQAGLANVCNGPDCTACHFVDLANRLITWLIGVVTVLFAVLMVVAGFGLVTSGGNQSALENAKSKFTNAIIGFMIILAAWLIVDTLMRGLVGTDGTIDGWGPWSQVQCWSQAVMTSLTLTELETERAGLPAGTPATCSDTTATLADLAAVCDVNPCDTTSCLLSCSNIKTDSEGNNVCISARMISGATGPLSGSVSEVPEADMLSLRSAGVNVANWHGINGPDRTDKAHPDVVAATVWMQEEGRRRFGVDKPFQVTSAYTRGVGHSTNSQHYTGRAVDIQPAPGSPATLDDLAQLANDAGFTFVLKESRHVHFDAR